MACLSSTPLQAPIILGFRLYSVNDINQMSVPAFKCYRPCKVGGGILETDEEPDVISISTSVSNLDCRVPRHQQEDNYAPLVAAVKSTAEEKTASFHFPGHNKGHASPSNLTRIIGQKPYKYDIHELPGMDLFSKEGPIHDAQKQAAKVFGSSQTWFLTGGTTCGIQAAIMATCSPGDTLILPRNSHISATSGMVLSGAIPRYIIPEYDLEWEIAGPATPSQVEVAIEYLESHGRKIGAVFITSPTYYGVCTKLKQISELCHSRGIPLIVDEAHGAHFGLHPELPNSALQQGADVVVQSTHKVLCSLTQSSMLHRSHNSLVDEERISRCLQTIQSTSPSFLLLASLDAATAQLGSDPRTIFHKAIDLSFKTKNMIKRIDGLSLREWKQFPLVVTDPLRIVIGFQELGISGYKADEFLYEDQGVVPEMVGSKSITFVFTPGIQDEDVGKLVSGLQNLSSSCYSTTCQDTTRRFSQMKSDDEYSSCYMEPFDSFEVRLSPREAFFARKKKVSVEQSVGKICGELICPYPPGIPVMVPGEVITKRVIDYVREVKRAGGVISGASDPLWSSIVVCD